MSDDEQDWMGVARAIAGNPKLGLTDVERELATLVVKLAAARQGVADYILHHTTRLDGEIAELQQPLFGLQDDDELAERKFRLKAAREMRSILSALGLRP